MENKDVYITIPKKDYDELLALKEWKSIKVIIHENRFIQNSIMTTNKIVSLMANAIKRSNNRIEELISENYDLRNQISKKKFLWLF